MIIYRKELVLVGIIYYRPDFPSLLNEYYFQTEDIVPEIPQVHRFLNYWKENIEAPIKDVLVSFKSRGNIRPVSFLGTLQ